MKAIVIVTDAWAVPEFERAFLTCGDRGFTVIPDVRGKGRTGFKAGDRVHPGGSSLIFTVVQDDEAPNCVTFLKEVAEKAGVRPATRLFVAAVEEVA